MKKLLYLAVAALCVFASCSREAIGEDEFLEEESAQSGVSQSSKVLGVIDVKFTSDFIDVVENEREEGSVLTKSRDFNDILSGLGVVSMERIFPDAGEYEERTRREGLHRWYRVVYDPDVPDTKAGIDLRSFEGVEIAEPERKVAICAAPYFDDPYLPIQWHYVNDGSVNGALAGADINVEPVWKQYTTGDPKVIVSVVDGGVDFEHKDLAFNYVGGYNYATNSPAVTKYDHGTHVAGTIAATNNNGIGVSGIAGGDYEKGKRGVGIFSSQVFTEKDGNGGFERAIKEGADKGAVISQNSWGYDFSEETNPYKSAKEARPGQALVDAINYFVKYAGCDNAGKQLPNSPMKGGVVFFSAGNDNWDVCCICQYCDVVAVGAMAPNYNRASYSNYGDWVDIAAPGGDSSAGSSKCMILSTLPDNQYGYMQGTSMACPHVSGVAALVVSQFGGQGFTNEKLKEKLLKGANAKYGEKAGKSNLLTKNRIGPLVDALGAITYGGTTAPDPVSSYTLTAESNNLTMEWAVTKDADDGRAYAYMLLASTNQNSIKNVNPKELPDDVVSETVYVGEASVGETLTGTISKLEFDSKYFVTIVAFDYNMNYSAAAPSKSVRTGLNNPPVITTDYTGDFRVKSHEVLTVAYRIYDPDGHEFTTEFKAGSKADVFNATADGGTLVITGNAVDAGRYSAKIKATDEYGSFFELPVNYEILENHAPEIVKPMPNLLFESAGEKKAIDMSEYVSDPDGEVLKYELKMNTQNVVHLNPVGNVLNLTTLGFGVAEITIKASDARGLNVSVPLRVLVRDPNAEPDMYPNPVVDNLYVSDGTSKTLNVKVSNANGSVLFEGSSTCDAFSPMAIDMSSYAPGRYSVSVSSGSKTSTRTIVKL